MTVLFVAVLDLLYRLSSLASNFQAIKVLRPFKAYKAFDLQLPRTRGSGGAIGGAMRTQKEPGGPRSSMEKIKESRRNPEDHGGPRRI
jgi:hypothetical protein